MMTPEEHAKHDPSPRRCTCHPDDRPAVCQHKYALSDCRHADEIRAKDETIAGLQNRVRVLEAMPTVQWSARSPLQIDSYATNRQLVHSYLDTRQRGTVVIEITDGGHQWRGELFAPWAVTRRAALAGQPVADPKAILDRMAQEAQELGLYDDPIGIDDGPQDGDARTVDAGVREDAERLKYVSRIMDGILDVDFHEEAAINASAFGREEPNDDDYLAAVRTAIDAAREQEKK